MGDMIRNLFEPLFSSTIKYRGKDYYESGLVRVLKLQSNKASFHVSGTTTYSVVLDLESPSQSICSCPYAKDGSYCKHMWAAVLKTEDLSDVANKKTISPLTTKPLWQRLAEQALDRHGVASSRELLPPVQSYNKGRDPIFILSFQSEELRLALHYREYNTKGTLGTTLKTGMFIESQYPLYTSPGCAEIFRALTSEIRPAASTYFSDHFGPNEMILKGHSGRKLLELISSRNKLFFRRGPRKTDPLIQVRSVKEDLQAGILVKKEVGDQPTYSAQVALFFKNDLTTYFECTTAQQVSGFVSSSDDLYPITSPLPDYWWDFFYLHHPLPLKASELRDFLLYILTQENIPQVPMCLPEEAQISIERIKPEGHIHLSWTQGDLSCLETQLIFSYDNTPLAPESPAQYISGKDKIIQRDASAEEELWKQFVTLVPQTIPIDSLQDFLITAGKVFKVFLNDKPVRNYVDLDLKESSEINWLEVSGSLTFEGNYILSLPEVLKGLRKGTILTLPDGSAALLPPSIYRKFHAAASLGQITEQGLRLSRVQAMMLEQGSPSGDTHSLFSKMARRRFVQDLGKILNPEPQKEHTRFKGKLRHYQQVGLSWLSELAKKNYGGILADEMGLGKTIQVLAYLAACKKHERHLLVVPKSLLNNWVNEITKFTPHLKVTVVSGSDRGRILAELGKSHVTLITYQTLLRDIQILKDFVFDTLVLDEAHYVKNAKSQSHQACALLQAKQRFLMTGTPIENSLTDLAALMSLANPGMLTQKLLSSPDWDASKLFACTRPFLLRRTKSAVLKDLPAKSEQVIYCEMTATQSRHYNELRDYYRDSLRQTTRDKGLARSKIVILEALLRLRQVALHPALVNGSLRKDSGKFEVLTEMVSELHKEGHKALIFSQFTQALKLCSEDLSKQEIPLISLDGTTKDRQRLVDSFQTDPNLCAFLISLKAGGVGLNLTAASYVFILDPWWNPAAEAQAMDRAHRIGQRNKVMVYKLIAKNTVDEKILELQKKKNKMVADLFSSDENIMKSLTETDLDYLFS